MSGRKTKEYKMKKVQVLAVTSRRFNAHNGAIWRTQAALPFPSSGHLIQCDPWRLADFNRFIASLALSLISSPLCVSSEMLMLSPKMLFRDSKMEAAASGSG